MPCAVSGRRYATLASSRTAPTCVSNIRLNWRGSVRSQSGVSPGCFDGRVPQLDVPRWSARKRSLQVRQSTSGSENPATWPDATQTCGLRMMAESSATMSSRSWIIERCHSRLDVLLEQHAVVAVVERRAEPAVDVRRREDERAAAAERRDLLDRRGALELLQLVCHARKLPVESGRWPRRASSCTSSRTPRARPPRASSRRSRRSSPTRSSWRSATRASTPSPTSSSRSSRMKGRPAVVVYTLVEPELRETMRTLCRRARLHYCDLLGQPIEAVAQGLRPGREDEAARAAAAERRVLQADGGDRVRGQVRRRRRRRAARRRRRSRRRVTHVEDAALDLPRLPRATRPRTCRSSRGSSRRRSSSRSTRRRSSA